LFGLDETAAWRSRMPLKPELRFLLRRTKAPSEMKTDEKESRNSGARPPR
jgi:hypothetical protein